MVSWINDAANAANLAGLMNGPVGLALLLIFALVGAALTLNAIRARWVKHLGGVDKLVDNSGLLLQDQAKVRRHLKMLGVLCPTFSLASATCILGFIICLLKVVK